MLHNFDKSEKNRFIRRFFYSQKKITRQKKCVFGNEKLSALNVKSIFGNEKRKDANVKRVFANEKKFIVKTKMFDAITKCIFGL